MSKNPIFPSTLAPRQGITFKDPAGVVQTYQALLNPGKMPRSPGNLRKWQGTVNGSALVVGQGELPPKEIAFSWDKIDYSDLINIAYFTKVNPTIFIDNRDNGYLGSLVLDSPEQVPDSLNDVWAVKGSFLVVSPSDGLTTTLNKLAVPSITVTGFTSGGFLASGTAVYVWATVWTPCGESLPGPVNVINVGGGTGGPNCRAVLSWTAPTSKYYRKMSLYWSSSNSLSTATWLTDIWAGQTQQFPILTQFMPYSNKKVPAYTRAYTGDWRGGLWVQGL